MDKGCRKEAGLVVYYAIARPVLDVNAAALQDKGRIVAAQNEDGVLTLWASHHFGIERFLLKPEVFNKTQRNGPDGQGETGSESQSRSSRVP